MSPAISCPAFSVSPLEDIVLATEAIQKLRNSKGERAESHVYASLRGGRDIKPVLRNTLNFEKIYETKCVQHNSVI